VLLSSGSLPVVSVIGGTGPLGKGLALRLALAGHDVILGSRQSKRADAAATELAASPRLRGKVTGATNAAAARNSEIALLAMPYDPAGTLVREIAGPLGGKLVISCVNPLGFDATGPHAMNVPEGSAAEQAAELLPGSRVAAAFHHLAALSLSRPECDLSGEDVLVCSDDSGAADRTAHLCQSITGSRGVVVGPLRVARQLEPFTAVLISVNRLYKTRSGLALRHLPRGQEEQAGPLIPVGAVTTNST
jgi:NADPH-dependent F420 reductase